MHGEPAIFTRCFMFMFMFISICIPNSQLDLQFQLNQKLHKRTLNKRIEFNVLKQLANGKTMLIIYWISNTQTHCTNASETVLERLNHFVPKNIAELRQNVQWYWAFQLVGEFHISSVFSFNFLAWTRCWKPFKSIQYATSVYVSTWHDFFMNKKTNNIESQRIWVTVSTGQIPSN